MTPQERVDTLQEVLSLLDQCALKLRSLGDDRLDAVVAELEGRAGGWVGLFTRDNLEEALREVQRELKPGEAEAEDGGAS